MLYGGLWIPKQNALLDLKRKYLDVKFNVVVDLYVAQGYENSNLQKQPNLLNFKTVCT